MGRPDAAGRDAFGAGYARGAGQDPLYRLLELLRLAYHEGAGRIGSQAISTIRNPADPLYAGGTRGRIRAVADLGGPGSRRDGVEPPGRRTAFGRVPPRCKACGFPSGGGVERAADPR